MISCMIFYCYSLARYLIFSLEYSIMFNRSVKITNLTSKIKYEKKNHFTFFSHGLETTSAYSFKVFTIFIAIPAFPHTNIRNQFYVSREKHDIHSLKERIRFIDWLAHYPIQSAPYCMRKVSSNKLVGNAQFEGYSVDLIYEISKILGFNYTFRLVPDERYGSYNKKTKEWDGMMKELLDQKADLAIADLTITYDREQAVDFTMPFMNLGEQRSVSSTIPSSPPPLKLV